MAKIKLGLIGCGGMANAHRQRFGELHEQFELVAAVDVDRARAAAVAEFFPAVKVASDFRDVLDDVEAVLVALPHHLHYSVSKACLLAGKHVLVEKPLANSAEECLDLVATAATAQRVLMVAYCMRFHPLVMRMKELLAAETYGEVFQVSLWTEQLTRYAPDHWASSAATLGGGQLFSHGCHYIDILLWYLGDPIQGTHMGTNLGTPWMEREGTSNVTMRFAGGKLGYHFGTWGARGSKLRYSFHAHCTEGMLEADISNSHLLFRSGKTRETSGESLRPLVDGGELLMQCEAGKHTENEMAHFLGCIERSEQPFTSAADSLQGLKVIWKMYEAEAAGQLADLRGLGLSAMGRGTLSL